MKRMKSVNKTQKLPKSTSTLKHEEQNVEKKYEHSLLRWKNFIPVDVPHYLWLRLK
jgi:hypothetical protein